MEQKIYPNITVVTDQDELVGYYQLFDAIAQGLTRRIAAVFIFNSAGEVLIQRRSAFVLSPNLLDFSAAGHVNEGDTYLTSAQKETSEELGLNISDLKLVTPPFKVLYMFMSVFKTVIEDGKQITIDTDEVAGVRWVTMEELKAMIERHPSQFTEPFLATWPYVCDKLVEA
jgi:isopentenyl-diphosphate Delta-isomerase